MGHMSAAHDEGMKHRLSFDQADRLGKALRLAGMTSGEMAQYLGVHRNSVTNWVHGHNSADKRTLMLWALRTGVPLQWLEKGELNYGSPSGDDPKGQAMPGAGVGRKSAKRGTWDYMTASSRPILVAS